MYNRGNNYFDNHSDNNELEHTVTMLKVCIWLLFLLVILRILASEFAFIITDLLTCLVIYCTYSPKSRCMAFWGVFNGITGLIYSVAVGINDLSTLSTAKSQGMSGLMMNTNNPNQLIQGGNLSQLPQESNVIMTNDNQLKQAILIVTMIFACGVYLMVIYYSYKGIYVFSSLFGEFAEEERINQQFPDNQNYGGTDNMSSRGNYNGYDNRRQGGSSGFQAFKGTGVQVGGIEQ